VRCTLPSLATLCVAAWMAAPAQGASLPFEGALSLAFGALPPLIAPGAGTASVMGSGGGAHLDSLDVAASAFAAAGATFPITDPAAFPFAGAILTVHNGAGHFDRSGGLLRGAMAIHGVARMCLFKACEAAVANLSIPLTVVGAGGTQTTAGALNLTVRGAPWTAGTAAIGTITQMGFAHGPASASSSTLAPGGALRLVTPFLIQVRGADPVFSFASLRYDFVPEPRGLALVGVGLALLAGTGARAARAPWLAAPARAPAERKPEIPRRARDLARQREQPARRPERRARTAQRHALDAQPEGAEEDAAAREVIVVRTHRDA